LEVQMMTLGWGLWGSLAERKFDGQGPMV